MPRLSEGREVTVQLSPNNGVARQFERLRPIPVAGALSGRPAYAYAGIQPEMAWYSGGPQGPPNYPHRPLCIICCSANAAEVRVLARVVRTPPTSRMDPDQTTLKGGDRISRH